jgi:hypothetical protein
MVDAGETVTLKSGPANSKNCRRQALTFQWQIIEGPGALAGLHDQAVTFLAPDGPD